MTVVPFCTDEDLVVRSASIAALFSSSSQTLARGTDGVFSAGSPWLLTSATSPFNTLGVAPGGVAILTKPITTYRPPGDVFAIDSVSASGLVLRRKGMPVAVGYSPGQGGVAGVEFLVSTFFPQIYAASYDLDRRYGVCDLFVGRRYADMFDPAELREACVLTVLSNVYMDASRGSASPASSQGQGGKEDTFGAKARWYQTELADLLDRVVVHWRPSQPIGSADKATSKFCTRIER